MTAGRLAGRRAVITGGATGIGFGVARRFLAEGAAVLLAGPDDAAMRAATTRLAADPRRVVAGHVDDLSRPGAGERLARAALKELGGIDILINNAGGGVITATDHHTDETIRRTIDNNLWTTLNCTLAVLPHMIASRYGRVVSIGAESVRNGLNGHAIYNAAKGGVHAFAVGLAREYATSGVTFNTVAPAYTLTPEIEAALADGTLPEEFRSITEIAVSLIPMRRPATVDEVAAAVLFLASEEASFITGQVLSVNGGSSMG
ncbi:SDR family oxidoreductase [Mycobacterium sp. SM1]|uniref:SDR family NAD(P)-dependent oxidoreductase n=1 Tax=Mycobacterium sp. SM1 TaxID=2816243 RepID=UPI001BCBFB28|nr:SDR family oxidoreductase [Mycobacterium sp. SM1]MBS4730304.1 SDR family oxidoreductase [Mycobacterium sp. SM1]